MLNDELRVNSGLTYGRSNFNTLAEHLPFQHSPLKLPKHDCDKALEVLDNLHKAATKVAYVSEKLRSRSVP
jgi:hypothetical protein